MHFLEPVDWENYTTPSNHMRITSTIVAYRDGLDRYFMKQVA